MPYNRSVTWRRPPIHRVPPREHIASNGAKIWADSILQDTVYIKDGLPVVVEYTVDTSFPESPYTGYYEISLVGVYWPRRKGQKKLYEMKHEIWEPYYDQIIDQIAEILENGVEDDDY